MILAGLISAVGLLIIMLKLGMRKVISYDIATDITITTVLMYSLSGTYSGMMAALVGGLFVSITLLLMKRLMVREELVMQRKDYSVLNGRFTIPIPSFQWQTVQPQ